jgi:hypothetical protein
MGDPARTLDAPNGLDLVRATKRYRRLVHDLRAAMDHAYGWRSKAARMLGVTPSYLQKVINDEIRTIGPSVIERAAVRFGSQFFWGDVEPAPGVPDFVSGLTMDVPVADAELSAMSTLAALPDDARTRVLAWATSRWSAA